MNRFFTLLCAASCLTVVGQVPDYVPTEGLVGWWPLDGSGEDLSFFENDAELFGSPTATTDRFGTLNSAVLFDGVDDRLISESFAGLSGNTPFTVSFWWKVDSIDAGGVMVSYGNLTGGGTTCLRHFYLESLNGGCGEIEGLGLYSSGCLARRTDFSSYNDNSWHHCAFVYDGMGTNFAQMWLDGELSDLFVCAGSADNQVFSLESDMTGLTIGERSDGNGNYRGSLDDLFIWNRTLNSSEILELFQSEFLSGCTQINACNYDAEANHDDGSCDLYTCKCLDGTVWNAELGGCTSANTADINNDGCVQLNDLLDLLSAYGDCGAEEAPWQCGDPLEYQGYDYETVLIGEQCWFAENCRYMPFVVEGVVHPTDAAIMVQGYQGDSLEEAIQLDNYINFGALYNYQATEETQLCPIGWHIPTDSEFQVLEISMGMDPSVASDTFWRGETEGAMLKSATQWNGADTNGFNALPAGTIGSVVDDQAYFWTSSAVEGTAWHRVLATNRTDINRNMGNKQLGYSVRCIKDAE